MTDKIRVLCVDDHRLVREGIALIIGRATNIEVVGHAGTGEEAIEQFRLKRPDVTLMDLQLKTMTGVTAIRAIRTIDPAAKIVVVTVFHGDEDMYRALQAGAATYLLKDTLSEELITVIRQVHAGQQPVSAEVESSLARRAGQPSISPREVQIIELITQGMRNKEIAATLGISAKTVEAHVRSILAKLGVQDRSAAITTALRRGIIHIS